MANIQSDNYVEQAERVMRKLQEAGNGKIRLTTSKIRSILSMVSELYNDAQRLRAATLSEDLVGRVQYLKMRIAYEAGREKDVKDFVNEAGLFAEIDKIDRKKEQLILFCHYMEALVAYHKFFGGRDN